MTTSLSQPDCRLLTDFSDEDSNRSWVTVNDNVMGGRSDGDFRIESGTLFFEGNINTNGGGFSSIRWPLQDGVLTDATAVKLRIKSDGRGYALNLRTSARFRGRQIAYRGTLDSPEAEDWREVIVRFADLKPTIFGQTLRQAPALDSTDTRTFGLIIADGIDGPFRAEIDSIHACLSD